MVYIIVKPWLLLPFFFSPLCFPCLSCSFWGMKVGQVYIKKLLAQSELNQGFFLGLLLGEATKKKKKLCESYKGFFWGKKGLQFAIF
jgi:hypothetical protein